MLPTLKTLSQLMIHEIIFIYIYINNTHTDTHPDTPQTYCQTNTARHTYTHTHTHAAILCFQLRPISPKYSDIKKLMILNSPSYRMNQGIQNNFVSFPSPQLCHCLLRWIRNKDSPIHSLISGFVAGWSMLWYKSSTVAMWTTSKLAEVCMSYIDFFAIFVILKVCVILNHC